MMAEFKKENFEAFLGTVRKYMQVRGSLNQKDLAQKTEVGVSTMSRFLSMKVIDINPQIVAKICAKLEIPLHEVIDFVEEEYTDSFIRLVKFYKGEEPTRRIKEVLPEEETQKNIPSDNLEDALLDTLSSGSARLNTQAKVKIGGKSRTIPFSVDEGGKNSAISIRDKLEQLTPRQKAYVSDFLSLDIEARDLIVDLGNDLFRYFRQKGMIGP